MAGINIFEIPLGDGKPPPHINKLDKRYVDSGYWKCPTSPTGAHHSHEVLREKGFGYFLCKYCMNVQKLPTTLEGALKASGRSIQDPNLDREIL